MTQRRSIAVSGASGLVGRALCRRATASGYRVVRLVRRSEVVEGETPWSPESGLLRPKDLEGFDAIVHLAGANIAKGRWTAARRQLIRESRVDATRALIESLKVLDEPPKALLCASAIGYYGHRDDELLTEESTGGSGFLADICAAWEAEAFGARELGQRVCAMRFGVVLSGNGGALARMLPAFQLGAGGRLGSGRQWLSWILLEDAIEAILFLVGGQASGPVNLVAPTPVRNVELARTLGAQLRRPSFLPLPAFVIRLLFGAMGRETLLASTRVDPAVLAGAGFEFKAPQLPEALEEALAK